MTHIVVLRRSPEATRSMTSGESLGPLLISLIYEHSVLHVALPPPNLPAVSDRPFHVAIILLTASFDSSYVARSPASVWPPASYDIGKNRLLSHAFWAINNSGHGLCLTVLIGNVNVLLLSSSYFAITVIALSSSSTSDVGVVLVILFKRSK